MNMSSEEVQVHLLLEGIYMKYGFDFRGYAKASLRRRLYSSLRRFKCDDVLEMLRKVLESEEFMRKVLEHMTISTTEMFRDPEVFCLLRNEVMPVLRTYPSLKFWVAGCSTGEEVYSLAILLKEADLLGRSLIYATDINESSLETAKRGLYSVDQMRVNTMNYQKSGGKESFSSYYRATGDSVVMDPELRRNIVFSEHNLVSDGAFAEMNLILCRNVMIYFSSELKDRVLKLFLNSLCIKGFLCLGSRETVRFAEVSDLFSTFSEGEKVYQKNTASRVVH